MPVWAYRGVPFFLCSVAPLVPVAFVRFLVRGIYGGGFWGVVAL